MPVIYKYPLSFSNSLRMPEGAQLLDVDWQFIGPTDNPKFSYELLAWALVDPARPMVEYPVVIVGTGTEGDFAGHRHFKSIHVREFGLVWHIFLPKPRDGEAVMD